MKQDKAESLLGKSTPHGNAERTENGEFPRLFQPKRIQADENLCVSLRFGKVLEFSAKQSVKIQGETNMKSKNCRAMGSTGIRFTEEQLRRCDEKSTELGISRNEFIRDAVEFYLEWLSRESTEKFLTPAFESVISAKLRDTEDRLSRVLFKIAVEQNVLARIVLADGEYEFPEEAVEKMRRHAIQHLNETNGMLNLLDFISGKDNPQWQD